MKHSMEIQVHFDRGYIADPYWPERAELIDVQKASGYNRAKSDANRRKALEEYLRRTGRDFPWYEEKEKAASRPFYTNGDGTIEIPETQVFACLVNGCDKARSASRPCDPGQVRSRFNVTPWRTGKTEPDGVWERFATVSSGTGQKLSNQRGLRRSQYIKDFDAVGTISFDADYVKPQTLKDFLPWLGDIIGIGASRKMGWGRFKIIRISE